jgi:hypothetical protein
MSAFVEAPASQVPAQVQTSVAQMLEIVERDLELPPLRVRWFRWSETSEPPHATDDLALAVLNLDRVDWAQLKGKPLAFPIPTIWLRATLRPALAAEVAAHEARHIWQQLTWTAEDDDRKEPTNAERDAYAYQERMARFRSQVSDEHRTAPPAGREPDRGRTDERRHHVQHSTGRHR